MLEPSGSEGCGISVRLCDSSSVRSGISVLLLSGCFPGWALLGWAGLRRSAVEVCEGAAEHAAGEFAVSGDGAELGEFARVVAPGLVAGEQHPVVADAAAIDLGGQPARGEADRPGQVGVDPLPGGDPVEEPCSGQLDVAAHAAAEVHQVDGDVVAVPFDQAAHLVDVGGRTGRGVYVHHEVMAG